MSDKPVRENIRHHQALLAYSSMPDPSLQKLHQTWEKHVPKIQRPSFRTLKERYKEKLKEKCGMILEQ